MNCANLLTVWSELLVDAIAQAGITDVIVSPGSRSTPFVLAAVKHPALRCEAVIDERAAGFYALGIARATGRAPLLLCTSGSAPAHYYPAVIEASESELPLVILSADRPLELAGCGAAQTTDQQHLFGRHARAFVELGEPQASARAMRAMVRAVRHAVVRAHGFAAGPVHLNARANKPLEPRAAESEEERALEAQARSIAAEPLSIEAPRAWPNVDRAVEAVAQAARPAIVAGPIAPFRTDRRWLDIARSKGIALFAEATSQLRYTERRGIAIGDAFDRWIEAAPAEARPDLVLEIGATPTSASYARWIESPRAPRRIVLGGDRARDAARNAELSIGGDLALIAQALDAGLPTRAIDPRFATAIAAHERATWDAIEAVLARHPWSEAQIVRTVAAASARGAGLWLGNSLPIRHADRFVGHAPEWRVLSQRGVNGIDGNLAVIAGAARAHGPVVGLIGDVTFAHDVGALALLGQARRPIALVVIDNDGGRIFDQLPLGQVPLPADAHALFVTPPRIAIDRACAAFGVAYEAPLDTAGLRSRIEQALGHDRATVLHCVVDPAEHRAIEAELRR